MQPRPLNRVPSQKLLLLMFDHPDHPRSQERPFEEPSLIHGRQDGLAMLGGRSPSRQHAITNYESFTEHSSLVPLPIGSHSRILLSWRVYLCSALRSQRGEACIWLLVLGEPPRLSQTFGFA